MRHRHLFCFIRQSQRSARHLFRYLDALPFSEQKNCVDCIRVIDVVWRNAGGVGSAARLCSEHFVKEAALLDIAGKYFSLVDVLIANCRREVFPSRIFGVIRRITRVRCDMAGAAGNADAVRTDELVVVVIRPIIHEAVAVPFLAPFVVEFLIWEKSEAKHARRLAVNSFVDAFRLRLDLLIQPQAKLIRLTCGAKSWLVYQAENFETLAARKFAVVEHLQKVHQSVTVLSGTIPKVLVATAPEIPSVAPHDLLGRKIDAAIQRLEDLDRDLRKIGGRFSGGFRFVDRFGLPAAGKTEQRAADEAGSDSGETEKIVPGWQQCLHRNIIDMSLANGVARKFLSQIP